MYQKEGTSSRVRSHKLNVDASRIERCNKAAGDGVLRDDNGRIDIAFTRLISDVPILETEHMATGTGIRLARTMKFQNLQLESDAIQVIRAIN